MFIGEKEGVSESVDRLFDNSYFLANENSETIILLIWLCKMFNKRRVKVGHLSTIQRVMMRNAHFADMSSHSPHRVAIVT